MSGGAGPARRIPLVDLERQHRRLAAALRRAVVEVVESRQYVLGPKGAELEAKMAEATRSRHAIALASGTDALYLSLLALGIGKGDEVLTTPFTFFATASSISRTGARPVFVDIDRRTFDLDPALLERAITRRTRAVLPVHLFGLPCDMDPIVRVARRHKLAVIEDAAQAVDAAYKGRPVGSLGDVACYSFYPTKNLGAAGDGGMVTTSDDALADRIRLLRDHGSRKKYHHELIGLNSRLDEIQAAVLLAKWPYLRRWNDERIRAAGAYAKALRGTSLTLPFVPKGSRSVYHLYSVLCPDRDGLAAHLASRGIGTGVYYPLCLHLQACYRDLGYRAGDLPVAEEVSRRILALPMYPGLSDAEVRRVASAVREYEAGRKGARR
ncbi:MAG: dTDP-3-amino-3,4,6-trideoxy-alpha-D-glucose transaminase [Candidatus Omnitrophica bacterium]|nr:dTDP-3-amino-3,4,6-trideoxy-alpha-D-glucose transaminase [Candidatus Omnitrophota bacterium]